MGKFLGTSDVFAVVASVDRFLVYKEMCTSTEHPQRHMDPNANMEGHGPELSCLQREWQLVGELPLFATILIMEAVPILHPTTGAVERHLLFVLTGKDQFLLYALTVQHVAGPSSSASSFAQRPLALMLLFGDIVESSFYQPHYDGALHSTVTAENVLRGHPVQPHVPGTPTPASVGSVLNPPMVAVSMFHKTILLIDIACCLSNALLTDGPFDNEEASPPPPQQQRRAKHRARSQAIKSLFSGEYWTLIVEPRKEHAPLTVQFLDETTIVHIAFGFATTQRSGEFPLYVLHTDAKLRNHLVQYTLQTLGASAPPARYRRAMSAVPNSGSDAVQLAILGLSFDAVPPRCPLVWSRTASVQSDLELEARRIVPIFHGVCVIGVQLVTYVVHHGVSVTEAFPRHPDGPGEVSAVAVTPDGRRTLVACDNGGIYEITVQSRRADDEPTTDDEDLLILRGTAATTDINMDAVKLTVRCLLLRTPTTPSSIAASPSCSNEVILSSLMGNVIALKLDRPETSAAVLLENAGPILSLAVVPDESSTTSSSSTIIASNGVDKDGGLYVLRTAVNFHEDMQLPWLEDLSHVFLVGDTLCFAFPSYSRFLRFVGGPTASGDGLCDAEADANAGRAITLEEGEPAQLSLWFDDETILLAKADEAGSDMLQVTRHGFAVGHWGEGCSSKKRVEGVIGHASAAASAGALAIAQGKHLSILDSRDQFAEKYAITCENEISCVQLSSSSSSTTLFAIYGQWISHQLTIRPLSEGWRTAAVSVILSAVPKSVVMCSLNNGVSGTTICCGLSDGSLAFAAVSSRGAESEATLALEIVQEAKLSRRPVHLELIPSGLQGSSCAILCCCDVPAVIYEREGLIAVTGVALDDMEMASYSAKESTRSPMGAAPLGMLPSMVVASPAQQTIRLGSLRSVQKVSRTPCQCSSHQTISTVSYLHYFHRIGISARSADRDSLMILDPSSSFGAVLGHEAPAHGAVYALMNSERCTFIESVVIGGPNDKVMSDTASRKLFQTPTKSQWSDDAWRAQYGSSPFNAVLVGTSMIFADETFPRSCRLLWGTIEEAFAAPSAVGGDGTRTMVPAFVLLGDRELPGAATCCSTVPNCPNRVVVGVNGSAHLLRWHSADRTFVMESSISLGSLLVSLTPLFPMDDMTSGLLVVTDWKHSVCVVKVNSIDNSLEVCARDPSLRGIMDLEVVAADTAQHREMRVDNPPSCVGYEFIFADDMMNIYSATQEVLDASAPNSAASRRSQSMDDDEDAPEEQRGNNAGPTSRLAEAKPARWVARKRLLTKAQAHLGDRISALVKGDLTPCASLSARDAIRGASDERFLFGTIHGALGVITPVASLPFRVYQLVEQHVAHVGSAAIGGCLDYEVFRDVAGHGQLRRPQSDNPSFAEKRGKTKRNNNSDRIPISRTSSKFSNRGFAHGDVIEHFLKLSTVEQRYVIDRVNNELSQDILFGRNGFEDSVTAPKTSNTSGGVLHEVMASTGGSVEDETDETLRQLPSEAAIDEANDALAKWRLPLFPLKDDDVRSMIKELLRTH